MGLNKDWNLRASNVMVISLIYASLETHDELCQIHGSYVANILPAARISHVESGEWLTKGKCIFGAWLAIEFVYTIFNSAVIIVLINTCSRDINCV